MMKSIPKITTILAFLYVFLPFFSHAQNSKYNPELDIFTGGIVFGGNASQVDGDSYKGYDKKGLNGGGIVYIPFGGDMGLPLPGTIALSMEVSYSNKGSKGGANNAYFLKSHLIDLHYGEVPILVNWYRGTRKSIYGMGFSFGFLGFAEEVIETGTGQKLRNEYPFKKVDFSFVLSPNIHLFKGFYLNPRFQYSMIPVRDDSGGLGRNQQFNNVWSIRLMYLFNRQDVARY